MMTVSEAYDNFIADRIVYCSPDTIKSYSGHLQVFFKYMEEKYNQKMDSLAFPEENIYKDFIVYLIKKDMRNVTIRSYCRTVKAFLKYCYEESYCPDYLKKVKLPKDDSEPKLPLSAEEVAIIDNSFDKSTLKGKRNYLLTHLMLDCGLRSQEVRHLNISDMDKSKNLIHIKDSKGNKSRIVLCPDHVYAAAEDYLDARGSSSVRVLQSLKSDAELTKNAINQIYADLRVQTKIDRLHPHLFRHTFATSYLLGGGNLEFLRVFMGHYDYSVTKVYTSMAAQCRMLGIDVYKLDKIFFERGY